MRDGHPNGGLYCLVKETTRTWVKLENRLRSHPYKSKTWNDEKGSKNEIKEARSDRIVEGWRFRSVESRVSQGVGVLQYWCHGEVKEFQILSDSKSFDVSAIASPNWGPGGKYCCYNMKNVLALKQQPFPEKVASFMGFPTSTSRVKQTLTLTLTLSPKPPQSSRIHPITRRLPTEFLRQRGLWGSLTKPKLSSFLLLCFTTDPHPPHVH